MSFPKDRWLLALLAFLIVSGIGFQVQNRLEQMKTARAINKISTRLMLMDRSHRPASRNDVQLMNNRLDTLEENIQRQMILIEQRAASAHADP